MNTLPSHSAVEIVPASVAGTLAERNVMEDLLATKRSENTRNDVLGCKKKNLKTRSTPHDI